MDAVTDKTVTFTSIALVANTLYWLVITSDGAPQILRGLRTHLPRGLTIGGNFFGGVSVARVFAALPATFTAGGTSLSDNPIYVGVRRV